MLIHNLYSHFLKKIFIIFMNFSYYKTHRIMINTKYLLKMIYISFMYKMNKMIYNMKMKKYLLIIIYKINLILIPKSEIILMNFFTNLKYFY